MVNKKLLYKKLISNIFTKYILEIRKVQENEARLFGTGQTSISEGGAAKQVISPR